MSKKIILSAFLLTALGVLFLIFWPQKNLPEEKFSGSGVVDKKDRPVATEEEGVVLQEGKSTIPGIRISGGFLISTLSDGLSGARDLERDGDHLYVSRTKLGIVTLLETKDGALVSRNDVARFLDGPHGLALDPNDPARIYFAEEGALWRSDKADFGRREKIADLPRGGRHLTRSLLFLPDGRLLVSIGSACDTCVEKDSLRGTVQVFDFAAKELRPFATGLRNSVFLTLDSQRKEVWATEMGRDFLGDDLPPDEVNILREGKDYGWPYCYGANVRDGSFAPTSGENCQGKEAPVINIPAHSAPLGLAFVPLSAGWGSDWEGDLLVSYHGSWNRSVPTGYKIVRHRFSAEGAYEGSEDFITGFLDENEKVSGRPVDLLFDDKGNLFISDDYAGKVYVVGRIL